MALIEQQDKQKHQWWLKYVFQLDELPASYDTAISEARQKAEATGCIFPKAGLKAYSLQNSVSVDYIDDTKGIGFTDPFSGWYWEPSGKIYGPFPVGPPLLEFTAIYKTEPTTETEMKIYVDSLPNVWQNINGCPLFDFRISLSELKI